MSKKPSSNHFFFHPLLEAELILRYQNGDKDAQYWLFAGYGWFIKRLALLQRTKKMSDDEYDTLWGDTVQLFFNEALQYKPGAEEVPFLERVFDQVITHIETNLRKKQEETRRDIEHALKLRSSHMDSLDTPHYLDEPDGPSTMEKISDDVCCPVTQADSDILREYVRNSLDKLPSDLDRQIVLAYLDDLEIDEIARRFDLTNHKVREKLNKAKRWLKHRLESEATKNHVYGYLH